MAMPDGVEALLTLAAAPRERLTRTAYNLARVQPVGARRFATSRARVSRSADIAWQTDVKRQGIVDSWPADVDDSAARARLGLRAGVRFRARVRRLPDPDDSGSATR